jgi:hypothetical protein
MESLNLNALAGSLPTSNLASAEKELLNNFRGEPQVFFQSLFSFAITITPHLPRWTDWHCLFFPTLKKKSGRTEHNEPLSILALDLQARVQLGLCCGLRRPAADDPAERV